jgi:AcrR family transcriptional regulator
MTEGRRRPGFDLVNALTLGEAPPAPEDRPDARTRLLIAAERLIIKGGYEAATTRRIASDAQAHVGQVAYYFGSLPGLFRTLADDNLALMLGGRARLLDAARHAGEGDPLTRFLDAYLRPVFFASAHCRDMPASVVVRELISHSEGAQRDEIIRRINDNIELSHRYLAALLPLVDAWELHLRLRLITGAAVYLMPTIDELGLFDFGLGVPTGRDPYQQLLIAARGVMLA